MSLARIPRPPSADLANGTTSWQAVAEAFLAGAVDSNNTRRAYRRWIWQAMQFMEVDALAQLNGAVLARYRAAVTTSTLAPGSVAQALAALRSFLTWAHTMGAHGLSGDVVRAALRTPRATVRKPYQVLSEPEVANVLSIAKTLRDRALLGVMLGAGLRVSEVSGLDVRDLLIDQDGEAALFVRQGKGKKDRTVPIRQETAAVIRAYLVATGRRLSDAGPIFRAHDRAAKKLARNRLTPDAIADVVARCVAAAGILDKQISPHSLRHGFGIRALRAGANLVAVSKLMGHASLATTQRYLDHLELGELRAAVPPLPIEFS